MTDFFSAIERTNCSSGRTAVLDRLVRDAIRCWLDHYKRMADAGQSGLNI